MKLTEEEYLAHYGVQRRSGRYPWGSGGAQYTRNQDFLSREQALKDQGLSEVDRAKGLGMSIKELRARKSNAKAEIKAADTAEMQRLKDKGTSTTAIAERMGMPESTVRSYLAPGAKDKHDATQTTANMLKAEVSEKGLIDVGSGVENRIGITRTRLDNSLAVLKDQGYEIHTVPQRQVLTGHDTQQKVLAPPGTSQKDIFLRRSEVQQIGHFSEDNGRTVYGLKPPLVINPKRLDVVYGEKGKQADGVIFVRPGVEDVSLGGAQYSQVRVRVGDGHYLKGMAMYKNDLPAGVDLQFNTGKKDTGNKLDALKPLEKDIHGKIDEKNPFGALISRQIISEPGTSKEKLTSAMNVVNEEGSWAEWSRSLSSQMLSKQNPSLAKSQLDMTYERRELEYNAIKSLNNNTVKKKLLEDFAGATDTAAVHLKAAQLPRQSVHVILPIHDMKPSEVYAPRFEDGEVVVLIRHPHGGTFEIPRLTVNNKQQTARKLIGHDAMDAIGIHHSVAERLSGADFDGDTVLVIPDRHGKILDTKPLSGLKDFDPVSAYPGYPGMKVMSNTQAEMGKISNLITDMSLHRATPDELARAVRHSMVVIDAEKKGLNHRQSYNDNGIKDLKQKYQKGGASTLISRKKSPVRVPEIKPRSMSKGGPVNTKTGALEFEPTNRTHIDKHGNRVPNTTRLQALAATPDAFTLSSGTKMETLYANHSNKLKGLANQARLDALKTPTPKQSSSAKKAYSAEVASLEASLNIANRNRPLERQAQIIAASNVKLKKQANPNMPKETIKKIEYQALEEARLRVGAKAHTINISQREWDAIQANAISNHKLTQILNYADDKQVRELATPKTAKLMTPTKTNRARAMMDSGYTQAQIAHQLGVSLTTLKTAING